MAIPYKKLFGLCSVLPRWGKHGLALCLVTSMPSLQDGRKAGVWFLLQTYRPDGTRGKEAGMVFFGKHGGPPGRGLLQRSSRFVKNLELRSEEHTCELQS